MSRRETNPCPSKIKRLRETRDDSSLFLNELENVPSIARTMAFSLAATGPNHVSSESVGCCPTRSTGHGKSRVFPRLEKHQAKPPATFAGGGFHPKLPGVSRKSTSSPCVFSMALGETTMEFQTSFGWWMIWSSSM